MRYLILIFASNLLLVSGQLMWKCGLKRMGGFFITSDFSLSKMGSLVSSPYILGGLFLFGVATLVWLEVLSRVELSLAYPLMSISYVLGVMAAILFFHEHVSVVRWLGVGVVCLGIFLISKS
ncbi:MAG: EamA family transporter [bacterium]